MKQVLIVDGDVRGVINIPIEEARIESRYILKDIYGRASEYTIKKIWETIINEK